MAKRSIPKTLEDRSLSMEEMYSTALAGAKERHMSQASHSKLRSALAGHEFAQNTADKMVEDVLTELVKDAFFGSTTTTTTMAQTTTARRKVRYN